MSLICLPTNSPAVLTKEFKTERPMASGLPPEAIVAPIADLTALCSAASALFVGFERAGTSLTNLSTPRPIPADIPAVKPPFKSALIGSLPDSKADVPEVMAPADALPIICPIALAIDASVPLAIAEELTDCATD